MQKNHFLLLKKFKNTESVQLWCLSGVAAVKEVLQLEEKLAKRLGRQGKAIFFSNAQPVAKLCLAA